jgi:hypothetical protein
MAGQAIFNFRLLFQPLLSYLTPHISNAQLQISFALIILLVLTGLGFNDLRVAFLTPEPAYEEAFAHIQSNWQPGDILLTMNTPAAELYLGQVDGFTVQNEAEQFLLNMAGQPVDRWAGVPWVGTMAAFNQALNRGERAWFVSDTIRQPFYFRGDWQAVVNSQMALVWSKDNALIYQTRPNRMMLPTRPANMVHANLDRMIELVGYSLDQQAQGSSPEAGPAVSQITLTLFWQPLADISVDYTTFLHLRNSQGQTVAQQDRQPLDGSYPTSHWQPDELVIDPVTLPIPADLPAGTYTLMAGLYRLDTLARLPVMNDTSAENAIALGEITLP